MNRRDESAASETEKAANVGKRLRTFVTAVALAAVIDVLVIIWVVPWADSITTNPFMSLGYIVVFFLVMANFILSVGLLAYLLHKDSYSSDAWQ